MHHYGAGTHVGYLRDNNEDSYVCDTEKELWIVADGMGGLDFGEAASAITTFTVTKMIREGHDVNRSIELAHAHIKAYAESEGMGSHMGTTIVLLLSQKSLYNVFWVGDSRAYLLDEDEFNQITVDHSLVQSLIDQGKLTAEEAKTDPRKNTVTRALGVQELESVRADSISNKWRPNQKILLCSDGLTDCVSNAGIEAILRQEGTDQELTDRLIEAALEGGGKDNVTVIVISASETTRHGDSDAHIPHRSKNDESESPLSNDSQEHVNSENPQGSLLAGNQSAAPTTQLELIIPGVPSNVPTRIGTDIENSLPEAKVSTWLIAITALAAVTAIMSFIGITTNKSAERPTKPALFSQQLDMSVQTKPVFPPIELPDDGTIIQVGLFTLLKGAEDKQLILSRLGLEPYIQKRATEDGLFYAVLLGPLSAETHAATIATLTSNNLTYFHRPSRGS